MCHPRSLSLYDTAPVYHAPHFLAIVFLRFQQFFRRTPPPEFMHFDDSVEILHNFFLLFHAFSQLFSRNTRSIFLFPYDFRGANYTKKFTRVFLPHREPNPLSFANIPAFSCAGTCISSGPRQRAAAAILARRIPAVSASALENPPDFAYNTDNAAGERA